MYSGDEFYPDDVTSFGDPMERADWIRDQLKNAFACQTCGSLAPAIIEGRFCCDCPDQTGFRNARLARLILENVR